jgi:hypothetical protein
MDSSTVHTVCGIHCLLGQALTSHGKSKTTDETDMHLGAVPTIAPSTSNVKQHTNPYIAHSSIHADARVPDHIDHIRERLSNIAMYISSYGTAGMDWQHGA